LNPEGQILRDKDLTRIRWPRGRGAEAEAKQKRDPADGRDLWMMSVCFRSRAGLVRSQLHHQVSAPFRGVPPSRTVDPPGQGPCAGTRRPREVACHRNLGPTTLEAGPHAPAGLQSASDIGPCPLGSVAGHAILNHDRIMIPSPTRALLWNGRDSPAPIELLLRHGRGADRDQGRGKEKAEQQAVHGTVSLWRSDMASAAMRPSTPQSRRRLPVIRATDETIIND
jgi:hypothetical protein